MDVHALQQIVHRTRDTRRKQVIPKLSPAERDQLIHKYHPDYRASAYRPIRFGPNADDKTVVELATLLEGDSPIADEFDLTPGYQTDVLVVGGGGAGCAAALHAHGAGAKVILATKLRLGDSNSVMAQGGMQISVAPEDSPVTHFVDTLKGGHMQNDHQLLKVMVVQPGRLLTKGRLLRAVWGTAYADEGHYLHVYVSRLRRKLQAADPSGEASGLIAAEPGIGYRIGDPDTTD